MTRLLGPERRVLALLDTIKVSEVGRAMIDLTDDGYNVLVGSTPQHLLTFPSYAHHPRILNHALNSTAAGAYQIIWPTWHSLVLGNHYADFSPENQDRACIQLITDAGAMIPLLAGDTEQAIEMCAPIWASLPGANYGQHENSMTDLLNVFAVAEAKYDGSTA